MGSDLELHSCEFTNRRQSGIMSPCVLQHPHLSALGTRARRWNALWNNYSRLAFTC